MHSSNNLIQYVGFYLSFLLPTIIYLCCPLVLFIGRNRYRHTPPTGSVLGTALRLWKLASRGRWSANPVKTIKLLKAPDFWESAKPSNISIQHRPSWMTFDDAWVDGSSRSLVLKKRVLCRSRGSSRPQGVHCVPLLSPLL